MTDECCPGICAFLHLNARISSSTDPSPRSGMRPIHHSSLPFIKYFYGATMSSMHTNRRKQLYAILLLALCLLPLFAGQADAQVIIGTGTSTQRQPFGMLYGYERSAAV